MTNRDEGGRGDLLVVFFVISERAQKYRAAVQYERARGRQRDRARRRVPTRRLLCRAVADTGGGSGRRARAKRAAVEDPARRGRVADGGAPAQPATPGVDPRHCAGAARRPPRERAVCGRRLALLLAALCQAPAPAPPATTTAACRGTRTARRARRRAASPSGSRSRLSARATARCACCPVCTRAAAPLAARRRRPPL